MKGSIIGRIVKEISLANYEDDTSLSEKVQWAIRHALPDDIRVWFLAEITGHKPLTGKQGLQLVKWLFSNPQKAIVNKANIKLIRQARREQVIDTLKANLPTPAIMAHVTLDQLSAANFPAEVDEILIPELEKILKRDRESITVSIQWALNSNHLIMDDLIWLERYIKPNSEYEQLLLRETRRSE